jgi:CheY-like chemotaxis protein/two-component sensor histidine kinase
VRLIRKVGGADPKKVERGLDVIERSAQAESRLVEDILDAARIASRRLRVDKQPVELTSVVRTCVEDFAPIAAARSTELTFSAPEPVRVSGDAERLRQIARNLLSNAVKFTPCRGHIGVEVGVEGSAVAVLRVRDDGRGIPREELPHVFDLFRQADCSTTRRESGLGLGLAIVRDLVSAHGGRVRIDSAGPDRGTTVEVEFPLLEEAEGCAAQGSAKLEGVRVLVVDDDADTAEAVAQLLVAERANVRCAPSAEVARRMLREFLPDLLVSDIAMPGEDGYSLLRSVRRLDAPHARVRAVALTALATPEDAQAAIRAGYDRHIAKPVAPEVLTRVLSELSSHRAA